MFSRKGTDIAISDKNNGADISAKKMAKSAFGQSNDTAKKMDKPDL